MNRANHYLFGGTLWAAGTVLSGHPELALSGAPVAIATAGGFFSPDMDQFRWYTHLFLGRRDKRRWLPTKKPFFAAARNHVFGHRRITHWWGWPMLWLIASAWAGPDVRPFIWAAVVGWGSHIIGDWGFGKAVPEGGIPAGVPVGIWWGHVGGAFRSGGFAATAFATSFTVVCVGLRLATA